MRIFNEADGTHSWRKTLAALCGLLFAYAVIGYGIEHDFAELPNMYMMVIAGVFAFYFGKEIFNQIGVKKA